MTRYVIKMPSRYIKEAMRAVQSVQAAWKELDAERAAIPTVDVLRFGTVALDEYNAKVAVIEQRKQNAVNVAREAVERASNAFNTAFEALVTPSGEMIAGANAEDFALFQAGLIPTREKLDAMMQKHIDNPAFRIAATSYAKSRGWADWGFADRELEIREFSEGFFKHALDAAGVPFGYWGLFSSSEEAILDSVRAYGILEEYRKGE